jgi:hypothetical protein
MTTLHKNQFLARRGEEMAEKGKGDARPDLPVQSLSLLVCKGYFFSSLVLKALLLLLLFIYHT